MYKTNFKAVQFIHDMRNIEDNIEYDDNVEYFKSIKDKSVKDLIERLDNVILEYLDRKNKPKNIRYKIEEKHDITKGVLNAKLGFDFSYHYMLDMIQEEFNAIAKAFQELNKFKDHRHKTMFNLYTEKPVY